MHTDYAVAVEPAIHPACVQHSVANFRLSFSFRRFGPIRKRSFVLEPNAKIRPIADTRSNYQPFDPTSAAGKYHTHHKDK